MADESVSKKVNDTYGHAGGDEVLRHIAALLRQTVRETDIPGRLGGEEFAVMLATDAEQGVQLANRLGQAIRAAMVDTEAGSVSYTASIGISQLAAGDILRKGWFLAFSFLATDGKGRRKGRRRG